MTKRLMVVLIMLLAVVVGGAVYAARPKEIGNQGPVIAASEAPEGFSRAESPIAFDFPETHGPHPDYQTEWWYYTGNLDTPDGRHFGYQLTFFRRALVPSDDYEARESVWATNQIYFAHFALTDVAGSSHDEAERFARGAAGLSGAQADPYAVWLENWRVEIVEPDTYHLQASEDEMALDLILVDTKGPVLQGNQGYSRKGSKPGNASYYYSLTRLASSGTVRVNGESYEVEGLSWMDHEFSTSALGEGQIGWDWFAIQLDDGSELMVFHLRREDGSIDPFSSGTFVASDGTTHALDQHDFMIEVGQTWESPRSGGSYPAHWIVTVPSEDLILEIEPYLSDQELNISFDYWEGAVQVSGTRGAEPVQGSGYIELTGYTTSMGGRF